MANIKTTPAEWAVARSMFEQNHKLETISAEMGASVPSISKRSRREKWQRIGREELPVLQAPAADVEAVTPDRSDEIAKQVEMLSGLGLADEEIAGIVDVPLDALREHYLRELTTASPRMVAKVAKSLYLMATDQNKPSAQAAMYFLDRLGGERWKGEGKAGSTGKKGERLAAAEKAATGKFATPKPPKLVVNNK